MIKSVLTVLARDLDTVAQEVRLYPGDAALWAKVDGLGNPGGNLVLHLAGNLQHFIGAQLGGTGYVRDRDAEFTRQGLTRAELLDELARTAEVVRRTLTDLAPSRLADAYPLPILGRDVGTEVFLVHLCAHLAYHLGQLDAHRRLAGAPGSCPGAQGLQVL